MNSQLNGTGQIVCWLQFIDNSTSRGADSFWYVNSKLESRRLRKTGAWHASAMCYSLNYHSASDSSFLMVSVEELLSGVTSFNHTSPPSCPRRHRGMIKQLKWRLIWIHTQPRLRAFHPAQHSCLVSCGVVVVHPARTESQRWADPMLFCIKKC